MSKFKRFEDLEIWQIAVAIAVEVYLLCDAEPLKSDWGMKDQIRRAACSMSDNIAEGFEYNNNPDFIRFLNYAKGSSGEFRNKLVILYRASKINEEIYNDLYAKSVEFSAKTKSLIDYLKKFEAEKKTKNNIPTFQHFNLTTLQQSAVYPKHQHNSYHHWFNGTRFLDTT